MKYLKHFLNIILTVTLAAGLMSCGGSKPAGAGGPQAEAGVPGKPEPVDNEKIEKFVEDVFSIKGRGTVVTGRIERGLVKVGDEVEIVDSDRLVASEIL